MLAEDADNHAYIVEATSRGHDSNMTSQSRAHPSSRSSPQGT
jgi:hypothetical protein